MYAARNHVRSRSKLPEKIRRVKMSTDSLLMHWAMRLKILETKYSWESSAVRPFKSESAPNLGRVHDLGRFDEADGGSESLRNGFE